MDDSAPAPPVAPSPDWQDAHVADDGGEDAAFSDHDEDTYEQIRNMMENPVMQPIQAALKKQLMETKLRVGAEVRDKEAELKEVKAEREQVGVELYAVQQQLARLQMDLESKHNKFNILTNVRAKAEDDLRVLNEHADALENEVKAENKKVEKNQVDLEQLNQTLQQVEKYNEELKGEVAVTRRATYKAEETVSELEKTKAEQDVYIDMLNENLKRLQEQSALYEAQLQSQSQETDAAKTTLLDAAKEMETIAFEKKQLMQQWKSSLIGIQRRDEALQATQSAIGNLVEDEKATRAEIGGTKKFIRIQQAENEKLVGVMSKLDSEAAFMEDKIRAFADERARLEERYEMLKSSLEHTVASSEQVYADYEGVVEGMSSLDRNIETVNRERTKLEAEAAARVSEQMTHSKAAKNLAKEVVVLQEQLSAKEQEESSILNEMARIRVDSLNTQAHNSQLQETLDKLNSELDEKDKLIEKYEMEIRQRNDQIEKKMSTVDRLNRKYEALVKGEPEEENLGPLEATIKHIGKETERVQEENREAQKRWLRTQTELVSISEDLEKVSELSSQSHSQEAILEQKRLRVDRSIEATEAKVASLHGDIRNLHRDMTRLNDMISKNASLQEGLANENYALETEFVNELKEMEEESVRLDNQVKTLKEK
jgi:chromosome segregation ATPase